MEYYRKYLYFTYTAFLIRHKYNAELCNLTVAVLVQTYSLYVAAATMVDRVDTADTVQHGRVFCA